MKRWVWRALLAVGFLALGIWAWLVIFPSPERVIRKRLTELARAATVSGNESQLAALLNSQKVAGFFTGDIEINVDVPGSSQQVLNGRDQLAQQAMVLRSAVGSMQVEFYDIIVTVAPEKSTAEANLTLVARPA